MVHANDGQQPSKRRTQLRSPWRTRLIAYVKRKLYQRKRKKEEETPTDKAGRRTATATVWMAAFTLVLAVFTGATLKEIHEGGKDTQKLAEAAGKQADSTKDLADRMKDQATQTRTIAQQAIVQANAAAALASAAKDSTAIARSELQANIHSLMAAQRAWVKLSPIMDTIAVRENQDVWCNVEFFNVGRTPSIDAATVSTIEVVKNGDSPSFDYDHSPSAMVDLKAVTFPNDHHTFQVLLRSSDRAHSSHHISVTERDDLLAGRSYIAVYGKTFYRDDYDAHWTMFCSWRAFGPANSTTSAGACANYNTVGDGMIPIGPPDLTFGHPFPANSPHRLIQQQRLKKTIQNQRPN